MRDMNHLALDWRSRIKNTWVSTTQILRDSNLFDGNIDDERLKSPLKQGATEHNCTIS